MKISASLTSRLIARISLLLLGFRAAGLLYSISTGQEKARWFGYRPEVSRNGQRLCLVNGRGHLIVYDLQNLKPIDDLYFATHISAHRLSGDGQKLFVLTDDQTAFEFDLSPASLKAASN